MAVFTDRSCAPFDLERIQASLTRVEALLSNLARLHLKEVALRYGITVRTVQRWVKAGRLPCPIRFGGPLWRLVDLEAAEQAGRLPSPVSATQPSSKPLSVRPTVQITVHPTVQL